MQTHFADGICVRPVGQQQFHNLHLISSSCGHQRAATCLREPGRIETYRDDGGRVGQDKRPAATNAAPVDRGRSVQRNSKRTQRLTRS